MLCVAVCGTVFADQPATGARSVKVAYVEFYPYTYTNPQGQPVGQLIEITKAVLREAGLTPEFVKLPLSQMFELINRGDMDLAHLIRSFPVWKDKVIFGKTPLTTIYLDAYSKGNHPPVKSLMDFRGKQVIVLRGYTYGYIRDYLNFPENRVVTLGVDSHREAFELLARRPNAYLLDYRQPAQKAIAELGLSDVRASAIESLAINWAVSRQAPNARQLLSTLESTYERLQLNRQLPTSTVVQTPEPQ